MMRLAYLMFFRDRLKSSPARFDLIPPSPLLQSGEGGKNEVFEEASPSTAPFDKCGGNNLNCVSPILMSLINAVINPDDSCQSVMLITGFKKLRAATSRRNQQYEAQETLT
ncbi:hypothetical protein ANAEL_03184 [Anaerolineales bacterium]|nr:hypothetical protein ANAEL_03184 [Anaerolineales bacterium]